MVPGDKVVFTFAPVTANVHLKLDGVHDFDPQSEESRGSRVGSAMMMKVNGEQIVRWSDNEEVFNMPQHVFTRSNI
jgi:hypothetical protein